MGAVMMSRMVMLVIVDVFQHRAVHGLEREPLASVEDAIGNGDVLESAVRFGAELDAPGAGNAEIRRETLEGAIQQRAFLEVAADKAVGDGDHLGGARKAQSQRSSSGRWHRPRAS